MGLAQQHKQAHQFIKKNKKKGPNSFGEAQVVF
jgi:hypothetical protein